MTNKNSDNSLEVNEENFADGAARYIRDMFLNGEILPGERIIEADIANRLGLSRGPVRDALKILEKEGLVVITPRKGTSVAELTLEAVYEIYSLRAVLEGLAASILAEKRDPEAIARLEEIADEMESSIDNYLAFAQKDLLFHELLCQLTGHKWLYKQWLSLKTYIWLFIRASQLLDVSRKKHVLDLHHAILDTIRAGLPEAAEMVTRHHSVIIGEEIRLQWQKEGWTGASLFQDD